MGGVECVERIKEVRGVEETGVGEGLGGVEELE